MAFRISNLTLFDTANNNIRINQLRLHELQIRASTGKRLNSIADDPAGVAQLLGLRRNLDRVEQFQRNIQAGQARLDATEGALNEVSNNLTRLKELSIQIGNTTTQPDADKIQAEVAEILNELIRLGNSRSGSEFVFGGFRTASAPFDSAGNFSGVPPGPLPPALLGQINVAVGESSTVTTNILGAEVFKGDADGDGVVDAGKIDIFAAVTNFRNALTVPPSQAGINQAIADLDQALGQVSSTRGTIGARLNRLETVENQLKAFELTLEVERGNIEDDDFAETITALTNAEFTYRTSLAVTARVLQNSLVEFLG